MEGVWSVVNRSGINGRMSTRFSDVLGVNGDCLKPIKVNISECLERLRRHSRSFEEVVVNSRCHSKPQRVWISNVSRLSTSVSNLLDGCRRVFETKRTDGAGAGRGLRHHPENIRKACRRFPLPPRGHPADFILSNGIFLKAKGFGLSPQKFGLNKHVKSGWSFRLLPFTETSVNQIVLSIPP